MRGFRGNRAAQNQWSSRFGGGNEHWKGQQFQPNAHHPHGQGPARPQLPEWMKTPETKAREAQEARTQVQTQLQNQRPGVGLRALPTPPQTAKPAAHSPWTPPGNQPKANLRLVGGTATQPAAKKTAAKKPAAKKTKPAAKKASAKSAKPAAKTRAKPAAAKKAAPKRKAA